MADETVFKDDWYYFEEDANKPKRQGEHPPDYVSIELPTKALSLRLVWFANDDTSRRLAGMLATTLYAIAEKWEFFLRLSLKKYSYLVVVLCDGREHANQRGVTLDWDFAKAPVAFGGHWIDLVAGDKKVQRSLVVKLTLDDNVCTPGPERLMKLTVAWLNSVVLQSIGSIADPAILVRRFWTIVRQDVRNAFR